MTVLGETATRRGAAFFDLDRTLIRGSSMMALAPALRRRGLISRGALVRGVAWHAVYAVRGANARQLSDVAERGLRMMAGWPVDALSGAVADELEALAALAYPEAIERVRAHQAAGERAVMISASLREIVEPLAARLGLDGAIASDAERCDGRFTGRATRFLHGSVKADAVAEFAEAHDLDLGVCFAYTDSAADVELLEVVGHPVAANPDRRLRTLARERGWPVARFNRLTAAELARRRARRRGR